MESALLMAFAITFGLRPQGFFACNARIRGLYTLGLEVEENSAQRMKKNTDTCKL